MSTKNVLQVGDDFAMAFEDAEKHVAWIGRCNQLYIANVSVALWLSFESLFVWMIFQRM